MTPEERKEYAARILKNPLWEEIMAATKDDLYRQMERVNSADADQVRAIEAGIKARKSLLDRLNHALTEDSITQFNVNQRKKVI